MSTTAPWFSLSIDWHKSEMFLGATDSERLVWVFLLGYVKAQGRAGRAKVRENDFATEHGLNRESVRGMLLRATQAGAVTIDRDSVVSVVNWRAYQDQRVRYGIEKRGKPANGENDENQHFTEKPATPHTSPITHHPSPITPNSIPPPSAAAKPKRERNFRAPTVAEVAAYCLERGNRVHAEQFVDHYTAKGWKVGNTPMKDWKAAVRTWERNTTTNGNRNSTDRTGPGQQYRPGSELGSV